MPLINVINFGLIITDHINQMITKPNIFLIQSMVLRDIWDLFTLGQFDEMLTLTVITLSGAHYISHQI